jgi:putative tricarboxylic transport membrane protein
MRGMSVRCGTLVVVLLAVTTGVLDAAPRYQQLRLIAPAAPGGGWDQTARAMQQVLQRSGLAGIAPVENIPGAAGTIGLARFVGAERGSGDVLMVSGLIMLGGIVMHRSPVTLRDVVPIARLTGEYEVIAVPAGSPLHSLADLVAALKDRPEAVSWGGGSAGGSDQMVAGLIADAIGVPPNRINYIAFSGGGESLSAILGGQVTLGVNGLSEFEGQIEAGTLRPLAISSRERLPGVNIPTLREQGIDVEFENWRSLVAPPGITAEDRQRLQALVAAMVQTREWRETVRQYRWLDRYLAGDGFTRFVADEETRARDILRKLDARSRDQTAAGAARPYPLFVLTGLALFAIASLVDARRRRTPQPSGADPRLPAAPALLVAAGVALHLLLIEPAGFVLAAAVLFWFTARAFDDRHPLRDAVAAVALSVTSYLLFVRVLQLSLPAGPLERWL